LLVLFVFVFYLVYHMFQFLWIVCFVCLRLLSCVPYVVSFSGLLAWYTR
jgi:hypothetical protein